MEDRKKAINKLGEMMRDIRIAMLTTVDEDNSLRSRPMALADLEDGTMWFFTNKFSEKVDEIKDNSHVNLAFADKINSNYISISGKAIMVKDQDEINKRYTTELNEWFPDGKQDVRLTLLKITPSKAEYWDNSSSNIQRINNYGQKIEAEIRPGESDHKKINM